MSSTDKTRIVSISQVSSPNFLAPGTRVPALLSSALDDSVCGAAATLVYIAIAATGRLYFVRAGSKWPLPLSLPVCVISAPHASQECSGADSPNQKVRTLKGIGVVNGAPTYGPLSGFQRRVFHLFAPSGRVANSLASQTRRKSPLPGLFTMRPILCVGIP